MSVGWLAAPEIGRLEALSHRLSTTGDPDAPLLQVLLQEISERRRVEAELVRTRQWLELSQDAAGACAYAYDIRSGQLEWSASTWNLYGLPEGGAPSIESWLATIHEEDRAAAAAVANGAILAGDMIDHGFRIVRPSGEVRHIRDRGRVLRDKDGAPSRVIGLNIDVTELMEARDKAHAAVPLQNLGSLFADLRGEEHEVRTLLDSLPIGVMASDATRGVVFINKALEEMWRGSIPIGSAGDWNRYEAWSVSTGQRLADEDWPLAQAILTGQPQLSQELRFRRFDGALGHMLVSATPLVDQAGDVVSAFAIVQDISAAKATEERSHLEMASLRQLGETTPDYLFVKDRESRLLYANSAVIKSTGRSWAELEGRREDEWHNDPVEAAAILANDARIMDLGVSETIEESYTNIERKSVFRATKTPIRDPSGNVIGLAGVAVDVTATKAAQSQLELLVNELNHRVKNSLAIVQSIARHAFRGIPEASDAYSAFETRLLAMAAAHDLLSERRWSGALIRDVLHRTVQAHSDVDDRVRLSGDNIEVSPRVALALSMAVHELCTNATKYGALSRPGGLVHIEWRYGAPRLELDWAETGGPPVQRPERTGFGTRMLQQAFAGMTQGEVKVLFEPAGLRCEVRTNLD